MKYVLIATALLLMLAVMPSDASAAGADRGIQIVNNNYVSNNNYYGGHRGYRYGPGPYRDYGYRRGSSFETHSEAVRRIRAKHSSYRRTYHPRSNYNGPPVYYDWRAW